MSTTAIITLAGGCFWCLDAVFRRVRGVVEVESGFSNGELPAPTYEQVCSGRSGHAEVVRVYFEPTVVGLDDLLKVFFAVHDPTQLNRQGADVGTQYRSAIYVHDEAQWAVAQTALDAAQEALGGRVVTELAREQGYTPAETYHQGYFDANPEAGYCAFVIDPKVQRFEERFRHLLRNGD